MLVNGELLGFLESEMEVLALVGIAFLAWVIWRGAILLLSVAFSEQEKW